MKVARISKKDLSARVVRTKVSQPSARRAKVKKAAAKVRAGARIDFVRSVRG